MRLITALLLLLPLPLFAGITAYQFDDPTQESAFHELTQELRCLVCQNQNIADSNAELAQDLRREVYEMLQAGQNKDEVVQFLVARYGDFVRYRPPLEPQTWGLWFGPFLFLLLGFAAMVIFIRRRAAEPVATELTAAEQQDLAALLERNLSANDPKRSS